MGEIHMNRSKSIRSRLPLSLLAMAIALSLGATSLHAAGPFTDTDKAAQGRVFAGGAGGPGGGPIYPGGEAVFRGAQFQPGQKVTLSYGGQVLFDAPIVVGEDGNFVANLTLPAGATPGLHPVVVEVASPVSAQVVELKVSPKIPLQGEAGFDIASEKVVSGLYQVAYSAKNDALFVTSAVGRPPVTVSELVRIDPKTLAITARATPAKVPGHGDDRVFAVYGVGVDDANGNVWVTNTRDNTVAVYRQSDLSLVKQFEPGQVPHSRDVIVDEQRGKVYASATGKNYLSVFDAKTLAFITNIEIVSQQRGEDFVPMGLELDTASGTLYTVSLNTPEVAVIDTDSDRVAKVIPVDGIKSGTGVAVDPASQRLFVTAQGSDNVVGVDLATGKTTFNLPVGAGALNVAFEPVGKLAYVANRGSDTITVVDGAGKIVANLPGGSFPNHVFEDGKGRVFAVNKARGENDPNGDRITRLSPTAR